MIVKLAVALRKGAETAFSRATDSGTNSMTDGRDVDFAEVDIGQPVLLGHGPA